MNQVHNPPPAEATSLAEAYPDKIGVVYFNDGTREFGPADIPPSENYIRESKVEELLAEARRSARAEAFSAAADAIERKLSSIMAGNYSVLVNSYKSQLRRAIEDAARSPSEQEGE